MPESSMAGAPKVHDAPMGSVAIQLKASGENGWVKSVTYSKPAPPCQWSFSSWRISQAGLVWPNLPA